MIGRADESSKTSADETPPSRFAVALGMGGQTVTGNRGLVWKQTSPDYEFKALDYLTSQIAVDLRVSSLTEMNQAEPGFQLNTSLVRVGLDFIYYGDLHSVAPALSFMSPFASIGGGIYYKSDSANNSATTSESPFGMSLGAGLKFELTHRISLELAERWDSVKFNDTYTTLYTADGVPDLTGQFFNTSASIVVSL
jgi:opacity protein-like surface antigen